MSCLDALSLGDGRELFILDPSQKIVSYIDRKCIVPKGGYLLKGNEIDVKMCGLAS